MKPDFDIKEQFEKVLTKCYSKKNFARYGLTNKNLEVLYKEALNDFCEHLIEKEKKECPHSESYSQLGELLNNTAKLIK